MYIGKSIRCAMLLLAAFVIIAMLGSSVSAADSLLVSYQGYLTGADDLPLTMTAPMTFRIYDNPNGISGTLWTESYDEIVVTNGLFNVYLGSAHALPKSIFDGSDRWLGISVNYDADFLPRPLLGSVVNAAVASQVHGENEYGLTGVSYSRLTALLVEAVKELKAQNDDLRSRLEKLEER